MLCVISVSVALTYVYTDTFSGLKNTSTSFISPFYRVTDFPGRVGGWFTSRFTSKETLQQQNESLQVELLIHQRQLQNMAALIAENTRLRELLNSSHTIDDRVIIAELIGVTPSTLEHKVMVNRGTRDGVFIGQPLLDASGLMGQVVQVGNANAQVLLITDASHAIPVQLNRTSERFIAQGTGSINELVLRHVPNTTDIMPGDLLVSSGLGQRFPQGYPVGEVAEVKRDSGKAFADVVITPRALMNKSRYVLLVFETTEARDQNDPLRSLNVKPVGNGSADEQENSPLESVTSVLPDIDTSKSQEEPNAIPKL